MPNKDDLALYACYAGGLLAVVGTALIILIGGRS